MNIKRILALILSIVMLLCLAACGDDGNEGEGEKETKAEDPIKKLAGYYALCDIISDEEGMDFETMEALGFASVTYLDLGEDGKGEIVLFGEEPITVDWDEKKLSAEGESLELEFDGDKVSLKLEGDTLVFAKGSDKDKPVLPAETDPTETEPTETEPTETEPTETEPSGDGFVPVSKQFDEYTVTVVGAEAFKDYEDEDAIRVYYEITNQSDSAQSAFTMVTVEATQDGYEVQNAYADYGDEVAENSHGYLHIQPGFTLRCCEEFSLKADGGAIEITFCDFWEEDVLTVSFDPQALPGAPSDPFVFEDVSDPTFVSGLSDVGKTDNGNQVYIDRAELLEDEEGNSCIRIYYNFLNNGSEATSMWIDTNVCVYQDGVQLESGYSWDNETDDLFDEDVAPGESVECSTLHILRSDNPVEVHITFWGEDDIGCSFLISG